MSYKFLPSGRPEHHHCVHTLENVVTRHAPWPLRLPGQTRSSFCPVSYLFHYDTCLLCSVFSCFFCSSKLFSLSKFVIRTCGIIDGIFTSKSYKTCGLFYEKHVVWQPVVPFVVFTCVWHWACTIVHLWMRSVHCTCLCCLPYAYVVTEELLTSRLA